MHIQLPPPSPPRGSGVVVVGGGGEEEEAEEGRLGSGERGFGGRRSVADGPRERLLRSGNRNLGVEKEAIEIPVPRPRYISRVEKVVAVVMTGEREASQMRGLTGKALL